MGMATPAPALSPDLVKRLSYSKYLLRRAVSLQREGNELATAEAVLVGHDAAEMLMRVVTDFLGAKPPDQFMRFWQSVTDATGTPPPHKTAMDRLNNLRVGFKHLGNLPNRAAVGDLVPVVTAFCHEIVSLYLKTDFETVSLADLIPNEEARKKAKEAEQSFASGDKQNAFFALGLAYDKLHKDAREKMGLAIEQGHWDRWDRSFRWSGDAEKFAKALHLDQMAKEMQRLIDITNLLVSGIRPQEFRRFSSLTPLRQYTMSGSVQAVWRRDWQTLDAEAFDFCYSFVIDFALRLAAD